MSKKINVVIDLRQHATILAALRYYQQGLGLNGGFPPADVEDIASNHGEHLPLTAAEIDGLCEWIN